MSFQSNSLFLNLILFADSSPPVSPLFFSISPHVLTSLINLGHTQLRASRQRICHANPADSQVTTDRSVFSSSMLSSSPTISSKRNPTSHLLHVFCQCLSVSYVLSSPSFLSSLFQISVLSIFINTQSYGFLFLHNLLESLSSFPFRFRIYHFRYQIKGQSRLYWQCHKLFPAFFHLE